MKTIAVTVVKFRREEDSPEETGIVINDDLLIVDAEGNAVEAPIWSYRLLMYEGHVVFKVE